jgi:hypothetical protein
MPKSAGVFSFCVVAVLASALWQSRNFGFRAGLFPWAIGFPVLILAAFQFARDILGKTKMTGLERAVGDELPKGVIQRRTAGIIGWILGFCLVIWLLGFSLAAPVMTFLYLKMAGRENWPGTIALTVLAWILFYGFFERALHIPFPEGEIFLWLK